LFTIEQILPCLGAYDSVMASESVSCAQCAQLWSEYAVVTTEHVRLLKKHERAADTEMALLKELDSEIQSASERRTVVRTAIKVHLATEHEANTLSASA
jgi:hypothetical protein